MFARLYGLGLGAASGESSGTTVISVAADTASRCHDALASRSSSSSKMNVSFVGFLLLVFFLYASTTLSHVCLLLFSFVACDFRSWHAKFKVLSPLFSLHPDYGLLVGCFACLDSMGDVFAMVCM